MPCVTSLRCLKFISKKMSFRDRSKRMSPGQGWEEYPKIVTNGDKADGGRTLKWWRHHCVFGKAVLHSSYDILFMKFNFLSETSPKSMTFFKKLQVKIKSRSNVMPVSVFYLWRYLWQTFRTAANFLYNSSLGRSKRFLMSAQDFNQSLWKLVKRKSTRFKTLNLQNVCKMLGEKCVLGTPV